MRLRPDLGVPADGDGLDLALLNTIQVAPGREHEWEQFLRTSLPKFADAVLSFSVHERVFGPGPSTWAHR